MLAHTVVTSIDQQARLEAKLRRELGDLVLRALSDERTEDIVLNPDSRLWVKRQCEGFECVGEMQPAQAQSAMGTIAAQKGTVINYDRPFLEAELPIDGSRFEGIIPPVTSRPVFAIRQRPRSHPGPCSQFGNDPGAFSRWTTTSGAGFSADSTTR